MNKFNTWAEETAVRLQESIPVAAFSLLFGLEIRESAARAPSLDPQLCGHVT